MKKLIAAWVRFSRSERMGIAFFGVLLLGLMFLRLGLPHGQKSRFEKQIAGRKLQTDYEGLSTRSYSLPEHNEAPIPSPAELFYFDPNTLDSVGFIRLGMPLRAVRGLMNWRRKGKHFYKPADLKPLYNLPETTYVKLEPYIRIVSQNHDAVWRVQEAYQGPQELDLNTADSASLERYVSGIGPVLAHKIVERRKALGGFLNLEQLLEVYKFPDTTFQKLKQKLRIHPESVHKINLNQASASQLAAHPYIGEKLATYILLYRAGIGGYTQLEQLRQAPLMNEEIYRKIAPYLTVGSGHQNGSGDMSGADPDTE
ncbi:MAG: helix-hairpin-helix domain-containing protein [Bacteroidetes bacterium]|nr:helix-hairpin-helix domain-containing protein [Bacteroidota bacterium]MBS1628839.1 helix-hairpin-helix domain-containing protein [Bacteroidota bacterium]